MRTPAVVFVCVEIPDTAYESYGDVFLFVAPSLEAATNAMKDYYGDKTVVIWNAKEKKYAVHVTNDRQVGWIIRTFL